MEHLINETGRLMATHRESNTLWPHWYCNDEVMRTCIEKQLGENAYLNMVKGYADGGCVRLAGSETEDRLVVFVRKCDGGGWDASDRTIVPLG